jgi:hypothetical protein
MYGWLTGLTPLKGDRFLTGTGDNPNGMLRYRYRVSSQLLTLQQGHPRPPPLRPDQLPRNDLQAFDRCILPSYPLARL